MDPREAVVTDGRLSYFAARNTVLIVQTPLGTVKICRLAFGRDGSIYVSFPYCREKAGILNAINRSTVGLETIDLGEGGVRVSTDVKFSHHASGVVQFSKTGEVTVSPPV